MDRNKQLLELAAQTAAAAAELAGEEARKRFGGKLRLEHKGHMGDLVTEVDWLADKLIVDMLRTAFPDHAIHSEEAGDAGTAGDWMWHVDPLDGTNNYALGIPLYGVCVSLSYKGQPVVGVVHDSALGDTYTAVKDQGAFKNGSPVQARPSLSGLRRGTFSWIQGHGVGKNDTACLRLRHHLEANLKRVLRVWAPSLTWAMLARGDLQGIVLYNSEGDDLYAGLLLAQEAGARVTDFEGRPVTQAQGAPYLVAAHPDEHDELLSLVREALG